MLEDKLNHDERVRLECLAQANIGAMGVSSEQIIEKASRFEKFVKMGANNG